MATDKKNLDPEQIHLRKEENARRTRRRTRQLIGLALGILIIVGAVSIISNIVGVVQDMLDNTSEYDEYTQRVTPLVWFDLLPFDSLETADPNALRQVAIWGVMNQLGNDIERNEHGEPLVPASEVDRYAASLFGPGYHLEHTSFEDHVENLSYKYDPATQMYTAPSTGLTPLYLASVTDIQQEPGGVRRVTVGYVNTRGTNNEIVATPDLEHPAKYMDYYFQRDGSNYYLYAIQTNTEYGGEVVSSTPTAVAAPVEEPEDSSVSLPAAGSDVSAADGADSSAGAESSPADSSLAADEGDEQTEAA